MSLSFLPKDISAAISNLNYNLISEIRIRRGQPLIIEYGSEYKYLSPIGVSDNPKAALVAGEITPIINAATCGCIYNYSEQMKSGFITVEHGVRIGIAGEYVTSSGAVQAIKNATSINIRIPHNILGCADYLIEKLYLSDLHSTLLYSKPGLGKTTILRDLTISLSRMKKINILVFDERNEIAAMDESGNGFDLGDTVDVVRCYDKKNAIASAIRAMKPQLIVTDELYGDDDLKAMKYAADCGICIIASSHVCDRGYLRALPFDCFVELTAIGKQPLIYDKNFIAYSRNRSDNFDRSVSFG